MDNILKFETVELDTEKKELVIIDQTKLPEDIEIIRLKEAQEIWDAIYLLKVRGAPAIGVAAAMGLYVLACSIDTDVTDVFLAELLKIKDYLNSSRPTAVNLSWALERMYRLAESMRESTVTDILKALKDEAIAIKSEDIAVCKAIGEYGLALIKSGDGVLTHCNAGQLATCRYGTATAPIYLAHERGMNIKVYADETRPLLQGARLTSFELSSAGIDVTLICDNMAATVMRQGKVQAVFVGCDRVAANGDTANKIGTSMVATAAARYGIPVYICAPTSTIDMNTPNGEAIKIEERPAEEVTEMWYKHRMAPEGVKVYNPAFDITDNDLIAGIITEYGIAKAPYDKSLKEIFNVKLSKKR
ncbi:MAG: S-methyl-5-thioribose-1-phosphate isomerase [Lachnospiraceae bacterium]|nr:S-methyl-5-thioribose-1-phosphate isomerase [Lachnospiraceae bacterium]